MWSAIASLLLGTIGWFVASFFGKPLLDFLNLRSQVHEEVILAGNIGPMRAGTSDYRAIERLRRLGAQVRATSITASPLLRWYLSKAGYDLKKAAGGLIGLSNSLNQEDRALYTDQIQKGLKLPPDYQPEYQKLRPPQP
jgi:hypothetical protein